MAFSAEPTRGVQHAGVVYAWTERLDETASALRRVRKGLIGFINGFVLAVGATALLFGAALLFFFVEQEVWTDAAFWLEPSWIGTLLSFALLCGLFFFYRIQESARQRVHIPPRPYEAPEPSIGSVSGKAENIAAYCSAPAMSLLEDAMVLAVKFSHVTLDPLHVFIAALSTEKAALVFGRLGVSFSKVRDPLGRKLATLPTGNPTMLSPATEELLLKAFVRAVQGDRPLVDPLALLAEAYRAEPFVQELLFDAGVSDTRFFHVIEWVYLNETLRERYEQFRRAAGRKPSGAMNRAMTAVVTPHLDQVSDDLTSAAVYGRLPLIVGRQREMNELLRAIEGGGKSVVLIGPPGTGKEAIIFALAERMVEERVPKILQDKRLVSVSLPILLSGADAALAQQRLDLVLADVARSRNIVLAIPHLEQMTGLSQGGEQSIDVSAIFADALDRGMTFAIATTTPEAYREAIEGSVLGQHLIPIRLEEPDVDTAITILESKIGGVENEHQVVFSFEALEACVTLSNRYMHEAFLPEKAIELAKEVGLSAYKTHGANTLVSAEDVAKIVAERTGIPVTRVGQDENQTLLSLEQRLHERVIGQDEAVSAIANALRRARTQLQSSSKPIASFLFCGPTGVGKTELAKSLADVYFGGMDNMQRFDMSEYQTPDSVHQLIGKPGSEKGGVLTEAVRQHPFSVVLLDELEKAHLDVLNLFLQVLDDGRLTDAAGRTMDFTNTIIIATSNAASGDIQRMVAEGKDTAAIKSYLVEDVLPGIYRPEFLNRFDGIVVFTPLTLDQVTQIAYLMLAKISDRLETKGIRFEAADEAVHALAQKGYDPQYGARPLRRVLQDEIENAVARLLLEGGVSRRDTVVLKADGTVEIRKAQAL